MQLQMIQANPKLAQSMLGSDPRMIDVLGVLMGIDMQGFAREEGSDDLPTSFAKDPAMQTPQPASRPAASSTPAAKPSASAPPPPPAQDEDVEMTEEDAEDVKAKAEAEAEKNAGAAAYKARDFPTAEAHFKKAWDLWPKDITFLTNLGAVHFEMGDYDTVIATCEKAVDAGREVCNDRYVDMGVTLTNPALA